RSLGLSVPAALAGAIAFEVGWAMVDLVTWAPTVVAPFAWMPITLWCTERLLRRPGWGRVLALSAAFSMQILPGYPHLLYFTCQLVGLRLVWTLLVDRPRRAGALVAMVVAAGALSLGLTAIQLIPSLELVRTSLRADAVDPSDIGAIFSWPALGTA